MLPYASLWDEVQGFEIIACMMRVFCQMDFSRNSRDNADPAGTESHLAAGKSLDIAAVRNA